MTDHCQRGARLWKESCPGRQAHGVCVKPGAQLRPGSLPAPGDLLERAASKVVAARRAYRDAWRMWDEGKITSDIEVTHPQRLALVLRIRECAAEAHFHQVEPGFAQYLRKQPPEGLSFDPSQPERAKASVRAFQSFLRDRLKQGAALIKRYMGTITDVRVIPKADGKRRSSPHWSLAAVARSGQVFHDFALTLDAMPVPDFLKEPAARQAYRAQMDRFAGPLREKARRRYQMCVELHGKLKMAADDPWLALCRQALSKMRPPSRPAAPTPAPGKGPAAAPGKGPAAAPGKGPAAAPGKGPAPR
jgi:hypothetical protein